VLVQNGHIRTKHIAVLPTLTEKNKRTVSDSYNIVLSEGKSNTWLNKVIFNQNHNMTLQYKLKSTTGCKPAS
jgi:hypothetical protein